MFRTLAILTWSALWLASACSNDTTTAPAGDPEGDPSLPSDESAAMGSDTQASDGDTGSANDDQGSQQPADDVTGDALRPGAAFDEAQCDYLLRLVAHNTSGMPATEDPEGYQVTQEPTDYHCFSAKVPWGSTPVHALNLEPVLDDTRVVHHFVLGGVQDDPERVDGQVEPCVQPPGGTMAVWAPGAPAVSAPEPNVGIELPSGPNAFIVNQIHYTNLRGLQGVSDRSGFEICATTELREYSAAVHWLGVEELAPDENGFDSGECTARERTRILGIGPHMHERGRWFKVEIARADGQVEVIHDAPFVFEEQLAYSFDDLWMEPGDVMRTTCQWDMSRGPVSFGIATTDEMCYNFTLAYPAGALSGGDFSVTGNEYACITN